MPAHSLLGITTNSGWTVTKKFTNPLGTGGNFCVRYRVNSPNYGDAFMKAMDLTGWTDLQDINRVTGEYLFEQKVLELCSNKNLNRIVRSLDVGRITLPNKPAPLNTAYYVIFEEAEGDVRQKHLNGIASDSRSKFRVLHHVSVGISQLHRNGISHQDIKPSNVLTFPDEENKISDLGRVVDKNGESPFSNLPFPGDTGYMPIEMHFGIMDLDFSTRILCDIYMVGSLLYQMIEGVQIKTPVIAEAENIQSGVLRMSFNDALPILISAHNTVQNRARTKCAYAMDAELAQSISEIIDQMCHPDPQIRGNTTRAKTSQHIKMDRFVGKLSNLLRQAIIKGL